jgi:hypothetical protein
MDKKALYGLSFLLAVICILIQFVFHIYSNSIHFYLAVALCFVCTLLTGPVVKKQGYSQAAEAVILKKSLTIILLAYVLLISYAAIRWFWADTMIELCLMLLEVFLLIFAVIKIVIAVQTIKAEDRDHMNRMK